MCEGEREQGRSALFGAQRATKAPAEHAVCGNVFFSDYMHVLKITRTQDWLLSSDGCEDLDERAAEMCDVCARVLLYERRQDHSASSDAQRVTKASTEHAVCGNVVFLMKRAPSR